jgi:tRNA-splicing ligase RtcB
MSKTVDNPRRDINIPAIADLHLSGLEGVRRTDPATLTVFPGMPGAVDGPHLPLMPVQPRIFATADVSVELGAVQQLATLARLAGLIAAVTDALHHASEHEMAERYQTVGVHDVVGTPDLHRGDAGVAIGSVLALEHAVLPLGPGPDIGCGMRLLATDLRPGDVDLHKLAEGLHADLFLGRRDIALTRAQRLALLTEGMIGLLDAADTRAGSGGGATPGSLWGYYDADEAIWEIDHSLDGGSLPGDPSLFLDDFVPTTRDPITGTIGRGNHFLELQEVIEVFDRGTAHAWGISTGQLVATVHTGSRGLGRAVGAYYLDLARAAYPARLRHPSTDVYVLPVGGRGEELTLGDRYMRAMGAAANFAYANRFFLGLIVRKNLRAQRPGATTRLVYDMPHNFVAEETHHGRRMIVHRKGATRSFGPMVMAGTPYIGTGQPLIVPGSMGDATWLLAGVDANEHALMSAPHGAGRAKTRLQMGGMSDAVFDQSLGETLLVHPGLERPKGEAPAAYKPIAGVIETVLAARLACPVARLRPLLSCKE